VTEPWQTNAHAPFLTVEGSDVSIWVAGNGRYRITWPDGERIVEGFDAARLAAHEIAESRT
jgi:hypothetical protein